MLGETFRGAHRKVARERAEQSCPVQADADGVWHVQGYASARAALRSTDTRQAGFRVENAGKLPRRMRPPVLWLDGPQHRELRRQTARFFTPRRVEEHYQDLTHGFADEQIARLLSRGHADLPALSFDYSVAVAAQVIGLTNSNRRGMARRLDRFFTQAESQPSWRDPLGLVQLTSANASLGGFYLMDVRPAIRARQRERQDDLISHLIDDGARNGDIFGECLTFAAAGMVTTREFITVAAWHLFCDPSLRAAYAGGGRPDRLAVLNEILRLEPIVGNIARWATADIELPGHDGPVTIPAGARIDIAVESANLDPAAAGADPAQICPMRQVADGVAEEVLSFGDGPHKCPGAHIAIQESEIFLTKLFALPGLRLVREPDSRLRPEIASFELQNMVVAVR